MTDWVVGWLTDGLWWKSELAYFGEKQERTCHVSSADLETHKTSKGEGEKRETENVRGIEILLYALCGRIHAWLPYGLSSMSACVICCFHCVVSQWPSALYLCVQAQISCWVRWMGHGSSPKSFQTKYGLAYDCCGKSYPHSNSLCKIQRTIVFLHILLTARKAEVNNDITLDCKIRLVNDAWW